MGTKDVKDQVFVRRIGGALSTCFSIFSNRRYSGGFFGFGGFVSSVLSLGLGIVTPSPGRKSVSCRLRNRGLFESAPHQWTCARYNETIAHQGSEIDGTVRH